MTAICTDPAVATITPEYLADLERACESEMAQIAAAQMSFYHADRRLQHEGYRILDRIGGLATTLRNLATALRVDAAQKERAADPDSISPAPLDSSATLRAIATTFGLLATAWTTMTYERLCGFSAVTYDQALLTRDAFVTARAAF